MNTSRRRRLANDFSRTGRASSAPPWRRRPPGPYLFTAITTALLTACLVGCGYDGAPNSAPSRDEALAPVADFPERSHAAAQATAGDPFGPDDDVELGKLAGPEHANHDLTKYPNELYNASIVQILAHRDRYHGRKVQVEGYLRVEFEGTAIYLSKDDADYRITRNAFCVFLSQSAIQYDRKYVLIEGSFDKNLMGHFSAYQGAIKNVTRVYELKKHD